MIPCLHFRSQWGPQTKPTKSAHILQRNYANEGKTKKRTLSRRSIPLSPRLKTHSFVKYLTHLCLSFELGDLQCTSYQLVWEKCPPLILAQTTWHTYRRPDNCVYVHMNTDSTVLWSEPPPSRQFFVCTAPAFSTEACWLNTKAESQTRFYSYYSNKANLFITV